MATASRTSRLPTGLVAAAVFLVAVVALVLLLRGGSGEPDRGPGARLGDYDPGEVAESVARRLEPVDVRPVRALRVTGRRVRWLDAAGQPFLTTPRVSATVRVEAGPGGGLVVADGVVVDPVLRLVQTGPDRWNYDRPLAPLLAGETPGTDGGGGGVATVLRDIRVTDGHVILDMLDARYEARSLDALLARGVLGGPDGPVFDVARAEAELLLPDTAGTGTVSRNVTLADARIRLLDGAVAFEVDRGTFGGSRLADARGVWDPAREGLGLDMRLRAVDARVADLPWLPGEVPEGSAGSFILRLEPRPGGRTALTLQELALRAPQSSATGSVRAVIGGARPVLEAVDLRLDSLSLALVEAFTGPLPYGGRVSGTLRGTGGDIRLDLQGRLTTPTLAQPFQANLTGRIALTEAGVELRGAQVGLDRVPLAALDAIAPGLPFAGTISGTVALSGAPTAGPVQLELRLEAGGGIITLAGTADLSGPVPAYDVQGRLAGVELRQVLEPAAPPVQVHATFDLEGRGTDPATAVASLTANGGFTGWRTSDGDTLAVRASVARGVVEVDALRAEMGPVALAGGGEWDFVAGRGTLAYELAVSELESLAPYLPADATGERRFARGTARLEGTASGTLDAPTMAGTLEASDFRWGEWATEAAEGEYRVDLTEGLPRLDVELGADELRTPFGDFEGLAADIDFGRPTFAVAIRADQEGGRGVVEIEAEGRIDDTGQRDVTLRTLEVDLQRQRWRLPTPARVAWTAGDRVRVEGVELVQTDGDGRVTLGGIVAPLDAMDLDLTVVSLPVGDVLRLLGSDVELAGQLSVDGRLAGPAGQPALDVEVQLADGAFRGVDVRSVSTRVRYEENRLVLDGQGQLGDSARIEIAGSVPARLRLQGAPLFELLDTEPIDVAVNTRGFPLRTLDPGVASVEGLEGRLLGRVQVSGTPAEPRLGGYVQLLDGALTLPLLNRRFQEVRGTVELSGREARVTRLSARSGGTATLQGTLDFVELTDPRLDLSATLDAFQVQGVEDDQAAGLTGQLSLAGPISEPVLSGSIVADDGAISLVPLQQPELSARLADTDRQLDLIEGGMELDLGDPAESGGLRIRGLTARAGDDLWFVSQEARARLAGTLFVNRSAGTMSIQGTLRGEGGRFELAAGLIRRQFDIVSSEIRFFGSPNPNPRVEIVASRVVRVPNGEPVDVRVRVTGTLDNPQLALATATGAAVPESELLSFLLFGQPTSDLSALAGTGGIEGALGQGLAYTGLVESLTAGLSDEVGVLDYFRIEYQPGGAGFYATLGVELIDDWFLDADIPLDGGSELWAAGVEWVGQDFGTVRFGLEPLWGIGSVVGPGTRSFLDGDVIRQEIIAWRKRWTY